MNISEIHKIAEAINLYAPLSVAITTDIINSKSIAVLNLALFVFNAAMIRFFHLEPFCLFRIST